MEIVSIYTAYKLKICAPVKIKILEQFEPMSQFQPHICISIYLQGIRFTRDFLYLHLYECFT